uniref:5-formyltetrahydrofolate cyclo-ligase n=1 Tax=Timema californicum TaxID=61474 RepID=A0A7R9IV90_TIMCA|nr:unnamed protein product [Timema californicum]
MIKVLQHPKYVEAQSVSVYLSFDQEIQTGDLLEDIFKSGKICYIPRFRKGSSEMEMIRLFSMEDLNKLPVNKWNIRQPLDDEIRESVFEAGLVFTPDGKRLGRGKAYYDQFLHKCSKQLKNSPVTLALAFKEQILPHLPTTPTDYIMDYVLYED